MNAFRELITGIRRSHLLSTDWFGEQVRYEPANGRARAISVYIETTEDINFSDQNLTEEKLDKILVKCLRSCDDGIERPNVGDLIYREQPHERSPNRPYVFAGQVDEETVDAWTLHFQRPRLQAQAVGSNR